MKGRKEDEEKKGNEERRKGMKGRKGERLTAGPVPAAWRR
jgi:hypothetical protein